MTELDLTQIERNIDRGPDRVSYVPYRLDNHRFWIAITLLAMLFAIIIILAVSYLYFNKPIESIQTMAEILLTPLIGLVGFVIGFYFAVGSSPTWPSRPSTAVPDGH